MRAFFRNVLRLWPIFMAVIFVGPFNFWTINLTLEFVGVTGKSKLIWQTIGSQTEMYFWWCFLGWGPHMIREADIVQQIINDFKTDGFPQAFRGLAEHAKRLAQRAWDVARPRILKHGEGDERLHGWATRIQKSLAPVAYVGIYLLGSWPTVNIVVGLPLCRLVRPQLRFALLALMLGNINTVLANAVLLELMGWLWSEQKLLLAIAALLGLGVWYWRRAISAKKV